MRRTSLLRLVLLAVATGTPSPGQLASLSNAALLSGGLPLGSLSGVSLATGTAVGYFFADREPSEIAPGMLAVLSDQGLLGGTLPVSASLSIRPVNSSVAIPVTNLTLLPGGVRFIVPAGVPVGDAELLYFIGSGPTRWLSTRVVQSSFAFFSDAAGGLPTAEIVNADGVRLRSGLTTPAKPGQTVRFTGSGLGYGATVSATIAGTSAPVIYAGRGSGPGGTDDILIQVPQSSRPGCYLPLALTVNDVSVTATISVTDDGSPCRHPIGLSTAEMKKLDSGGRIATVTIRISSGLEAAGIEAAHRTEFVSVSQGQSSAGDLVGFYPGPASQAGIQQLPSSRQAYFVWVSGSGVLGTPPPRDIGATSAIRSGNRVVTVQDYGQSVVSGEFRLPADSGASWGPTFQFQTGPALWQNSGGKDLASTQVPFTLPSPVLLKGGAPVIIRNGADVKVEWGAAGYDPAAILTLSLSAEPDFFVSYVVSAAAGSLTIPQASLGIRPEGVVGLISVSIRLLSPIALLRQANGDPLLVVLQYYTSDSRPVDFR